MKFVLLVNCRPYWLFYACQGVLFRLNVIKLGNKIMNQEQDDWKIRTLMIKEHGSTKEKMDNFGQLSAILGAILIFFCYISKRLAWAHWHEKRKLEAWSKNYKIPQRIWFKEWRHCDLTAILVAILIFFFSFWYVMLDLIKMKNFILEEWHKNKWKSIFWEFQ